MSKMLLKKLSVWIGPEGTMKYILYSVSHRFEIYLGGVASGGNWEFYISFHKLATLLIHLLFHDKPWHMVCLVINNSVFQIWPNYFSCVRVGVYWRSESWLVVKSPGWNLCAVLFAEMQNGPVARLWAPVRSSLAKLKHVCVSKGETLVWEAGRTQ